MKQSAFAIAAALAFGLPSAFAGQRTTSGGDFQDYARVIDVDPEYERVNTPRQECYSEYVPASSYERRGNGLVGPLIGGVAGGLLGSQVGGGSGKVAAAAAGAAIGAIVGDRLSHRNGGREAYYEREVRRCRTVDNWERRIAGYRVEYEYQGRRYSTVLPYDPGPRLAVNVTVAPVSGGTYDDWH